MAKKSILGFLLILAAFLTYVATLPSEFSSEQGRKIYAQPAVVSTFITEPEKLKQWLGGKNLKAEAAEEPEAFIVQEEGVRSTLVFLGNTKVAAVIWKREGQLSFLEKIYSVFTDIQKFKSEEMNAPLEKLDRLVKSNQSTM